MLRNKFDALQEISKTPTPNDKYENFVNAHLEAAAEYIPTKQRAPWKTLAVRKKHADVNHFPMQYKEPNQYQCSET